ncbi:hypothetical protein BASA61_005961 [Batrachochytrium salamandrivorans]|nr:hypothetical protein BASA61_009562 [Batrachochytrium salamandrivorans]KAH6588401.1 hypothetical protein BASA61_005945 [Batrachochytrium salamandrivorans]KAH6588417.1 hypothetical protein BASA61_005961 [Batrachochytrium salamandrivorans]
MNLGSLLILAMTVAATAARTSAFDKRSSHSGSNNGGVSQAKGGSHIHRRSIRYRRPGVWSSSDGSGII